MSMGILRGNDIDFAFKERAFYYFNSRCFQVCADIGFRKDRDALGRSQVPFEST